MFRSLISIAVAGLFAGTMAQVNVVSDAGWEVAVDTNTAIAVPTYTIDTNKVSDSGIISAAFINIPMDTSYNVGCHLDAYFDLAFTGVDSIALTYKATKGFDIVLAETTLVSTEVPTFKTLAAASTPTTVNIAMTDLKRYSDWGTGYTNLTAPLAVALVNSITFDPLGSANDISSAAVTNDTITITKLVLHGYVGNAIITPAFAASKLASISVRNGIASFNVKKAGNYNLAVYSVSGRLISTLASGNVAAGVHTERLGAMAAGTYILRLKSPEGVLSTRIAVQ